MRATMRMKSDNSYGKNFKLQSSKQREALFGSQLAVQKQSNGQELSSWCHVLSEWVCACQGCWAVTVLLMSPIFSFFALSILPLPLPSATPYLLLGGSLVNPFLSRFNKCWIDDHSLQLIMLFWWEHELGNLLLLSRGGSMVSLLPSAP